MAKNKQKEIQEEVAEEAVAEASETVEETPEVNEWEEKYNAERDAHLRVAAEFDNFRKRTAREKESAWTDSKAQTVAAFLPVYDNLERALKQDTADEAYKKGVEMTMNGLKDVLTRLGVETIPAMGEVFDPNLHNAVMHVDDDSVEENTIVDVFQQGFKCGEKVIRFAMVKVAN